MRCDAATGNGAPFICRNNPYGHRCNLQWSGHENHVCDCGAGFTFIAAHVQEFVDPVSYFAIPERKAMNPFKTGDIVKYKNSGTSQTYKVIATVSPDDYGSDTLTLPIREGNKAYIIERSVHFELVPKKFEVGKRYRYPDDPITTYEVVSVHGDYALLWILYDNGATRSGIALKQSNRDRVVEVPWWRPPEANSGSNE